VPHPDAFEMRTGRGVVATFEDHTIAVGKAELLADLAIPIPPAAAAHLSRLVEAGNTAVLVALDGEVVGALGIADPVRSTSAAAVRRLQNAGVRRILMLTGDDPRTANAIARAAGVTEVHAALMPEDKLAIVRGLRDEGYIVAMAGDGINDAPALAAADIGIAMGAAGTDIAIETADIALMTDDLLKVSEAIGLSKKTLGNIRQNVVIALATVTVLLAGVLLGRVHMAGGMFVHEISVLVVILNGMRLLRA
jgi:Zn2+/Cd2+-exporting ATPase